MTAQPPSDATARTLPDALPIKPRDRLLALAARWSAATGRSLGALSSVVMNHGGALERLRDPANAVTDATLERFAAHLVDPANWPDGAVPVEAVDFAHVTGISAADPAPSRGNSPADTPRLGAAA